MKLLLAFINKIQEQGKSKKADSHDIQDSSLSAVHIILVVFDFDYPGNLI